MARDFSEDRAFAPTVPDDLRDPPRFGQILETVKDSLVLELRKFFASAQQSSARRIELPTIEKYAAFGSGTLDPYSTAVEVLRKHADKLEKLPHVAVMASSAVEKRIAIGIPFAASVAEAPQIVCTPEPYALEDGTTVVFRTTPDGLNEHLDSVTFTANRFPSGAPIGAALAQDVANEINAQAAHVFAYTYDDGDDIFLVVESGGSISGKEGRIPTSIEVDSMSDESTLDALGLGRVGDVIDIGGTRPNMTITTTSGSFSSADIGRYIVLSDSTRSYFNDGRFLITNYTSGGVDTVTYTNKYGRSETGSPTTWFVGLRDDNTNTLRPPKHRYCMMFDVDVQIDTICDDENTRGELVDLVLSFFGFFLESKFFTFYGRSTFDRTVPNEYFQIVINSPIRSSGENEYPRTGDGTGKLYVNTFGLNLTISMYLDRERFADDDGTVNGVSENLDLVFDETLPLADE